MLVKNLRNYGEYYNIGIKGMHWEHSMREAFINSILEIQVVLLLDASGNLSKKDIKTFSESETSFPSHGLANFRIMNIIIMIIKIIMIMVMMIICDRRGDIMQQSIQCSFMTGALTDIPSIEVNIILSSSSSLTSSLSLLYLLTASYVTYQLLRSYL